MKRDLLFMALFFGAMATPALSAETIRFKGNLVLAHWSQDDECSHAETQLTGAESVTKTKADGTTVEEIRDLRLAITKVNFCTQSLDIFAFGGTDVGTFTPASNQSTATIIATIPVFDEATQSDINMDVNVTVNATDLATTRKSRFRSRTPLGTSGTSVLDVNRPGAATGIITDGINSYTYGDSDLGFLSFSKTGQFSTTR